MSTNTGASQPEETGLPPFEQVADWPQQAVREQNWAAAARRWAVLREAYPRHPGTWIQAALAHIEAGELKTAETLLNHAREHFPNLPNVLTQSAELAIRRQAWDSANAFLQQAREQFPEDLNTWIKSSELAEHQRDMAQATTYNEKARQCAPNQATAYIQYAELAMRAEQWDQAMDRWETVRRKFPDVPAGYLRAAEAARQLGHSKEARKLILAHQYGEEILEPEAHMQSPPARQVRRSSPRQLLQLIWTKARFNLRSEVNRNYLSYGWWVLEPLLHMVVYYLVFGLLLQRGGENYPVFLLTGLIPWMWFSKAVSSSSNSIIAGQGLLLQVGLPSIVFPLVTLLQATLKQIPVFLLLLGFLWLQGFIPGTNWWALVPVIVVQAVLTTAFACSVAALIPFARDLSYLVPTGLMFLMFASGIFYDYRTIPENWQSLFLANPLAFLLKSYREILVDGTLPDFHTLAGWGVGSALACVLVVLAYQRLRYIYPRVVME